MLKVVDPRNYVALNAMKHLLRHVESPQRQHAKALREAYKLVECIPETCDQEVLRAVLVHAPLRQA